MPMDVTLLFGALALVFAMLLPHARTRASVLGCNLAICLNCMAIWFVYGDYFPAFSAAFVALMMVFQILIGDAPTRRSTNMRAGVSLFAIGALCLFLYETPVDLIFLSGVILCRVGDTRLDVKTVKVLYFLGAVTYGLHAGLEGNIYGVLVDVVLVASMLWSLRPQIARHLRGMLRTKQQQAEMAVM